MPIKPGNRNNKAFAGVSALIDRLSTLALQTTSIKINNEINEIVAELFVLHKALQRIRHERHYIDDCDLDIFLDSLIDGGKSNAD